MSTTSSVAAASAAGGAAHAMLLPVKSRHRPLPHSPPLPDTDADTCARAECARCQSPRHAAAAASRCSPFLALFRAQQLRSSAPVFLHYVCFNIGALLHSTLRLLNSILVRPHYSN